MTRKSCHRRHIVPLPPPGLRPKLSAAQVRDLGLCHVINLDAIARGDAEPSMLWDLAGSVLTWSRAAQLAGMGVPEMTRQLEMVERLIDRFRRTNLVRFDGPDYQLAKTGLDVMDELARTVDKATAMVAADWSERQVNRMAAEITRLQQKAPA